MLDQEVLLLERTEEGNSNQPEQNRESNKWQHKRQAARKKPREAQAKEAQRSMRAMTANNLNFSDRQLSVAVETLL